MVCTTTAQTWKTVSVCISQIISWFGTVNLHRETQVLMRFSNDNPLCTISGQAGTRHFHSSAQLRLLWNLFSRPVTFCNIRSPDNITCHIFFRKHLNQIWLIQAIGKRPSPAPGTLQTFTRSAAVSAVSTVVTTVNLRSAGAYLITDNTSYVSNVADKKKKRLMRTDFPCFHYQRLQVDNKHLMQCVIPFWSDLHQKFICFSLLEARTFFEH